MKILIVDDNEDARLILKKTFESVGHTVEEATNGEEALEMARESPPDMIISDILMPVMDGYRFCKEVRRDDKLKHLPFVFHTSSYTDSRDEELALGLGADRFIIKPVAPDEFIKIIQDIIRDVKKGKIKPKKVALKEDKDLINLYSERLVKQLEQKMVALESEITARKRVEEALRESYEALSESQCIAKLGSWELDLNSQIITLSEEHQFITGRESKETVLPLAQYAADYIVEEDVAIIQDRLAFAAQNIENNSYHDNFEYRLKTDDVGGYKNFAVQSRFKSKGIISGITQDITERKLAEKKIKEYSENLERMVEERTKELNRALYDTEEARDRIDGILKSIADGLIVTDIHNRIVLMNRAAEVFLGVRFSEVFDRPIDFSISDETLPNRLESILSAKEAGVEFDFQLPGDDPKRPKIMHARTSVIYGRQGEATGVVTIMHAVPFRHESKQSRGGP